MKKLVFFLEEASAEVMLQGLLPRLLPSDVGFRCVVFEGKQHLEKNLVNHLRVHSGPDTRCIVLRDQDAAACEAVKQKLVLLCGPAKAPGTLVRVACRELESWYLADLLAVEAGLEMKNLSKQQNKKKFRAPDRLGSPARELATLTACRYQKVGGSRAIGPHLDLENTRSTSFKHFVGGIRRLVQDLEAVTTGPLNA